jgi:glycosyltransferase involved in cell wall biosynthesis
MNIAVDGNEANVEHKVGVSVYTYELLQYFRKKATKDIRFTIFLRTEPMGHMPTQTEFFSYRVVYGPFGWSQIFLPLRLLFDYLTGIRYTVFFSPAHYAPRFLFCRSVVTIHDVSFLYFPNEFLKKDLYQLVNWTRYSVQKASSIIAVSQTTKKDVITQYNVTEKKVTVIHNGYSAPVPNTEVQKDQPPYILYVGTLQPRKNITALVSAFERFHALHPEFRLKIAGKKGWMYESTMHAVQTSPVSKSIDLLGYVSDTEKQELYSNAFCFVLPSFYEGFGIPLLEAMSNGCPVIAADAASLPEVGGDACLYFNPHKSDELFDRLQQLTKDRTMAESLVQKGRMRASQFSWETCAEKTLAILRHTTS